MSKRSVLRDRREDRRVPVTNMELFFDLVYVFTIIQLSGHLFDDLSWTGGLQTLVMFMAVWWGWNYTAWATGFVDPSSGPVALLLAVQMLLGIIMAAVIPHAFTTHGQTFAEVYVVIQLMRSSFMVWAFGIKQTMGRNYAQLLAWSAISGVIWVAGGFVHGDTRLIVWAVAALVDLGAPIHGFHIPGLGSTPIASWTVAGAHLAERCQLVLMIAFGETVMRLGEAYYETHATTWVEVALVVGFILTASLWSIYFLHHVPMGEQTIKTAKEDAGRLSRGAFAYAHMVMVGAVIVIAVAIHLAIEDPTEHVHASFAIPCLVGPGLFLAGLTMSKRWLGHGRTLPGALGAVALTIFGLAGAHSERLVELGIATAICVGLAAWAQLEPAEDEAVTA